MIVAMLIAETVYGAGDMVGYDFPQLQRSLFNH